MLDETPGYLEDLNNELSSSGGYCCTGNDDNDPSKPLCSGTKGCYLTDQSVNDVTSQFREFCSEGDGATDKFCAVPLCETGSTYEICEEYDITTEEALGPFEFDESLQDKKLCNVPSGQWGEVVVGQVTTVDTSSCDTSLCEEVEYTVCEPTGGVANCDAICSDASDPSSCQKVCKDGFDCENKTTYRGSDCKCPKNGVEDIIIQKPDGLLNQCKYIVTCNGYGCSFNNNADSGYNCEECTAQGGCDHTCGPSLEYEVSDTTTQTACTNSLDCDTQRSIFSEQNVQCVGQNSLRGLPLLIKNSNSDETFVCSDEENKLNEGDVFCPQGYEYRKNYDNNEMECVKKDYVCDFGDPDSAQGLQKGCDSLTGNSDYWGLYNDGCVSDSDDSTGSVYDEACCYDVTFNDMDVYQSEVTDGFVKVY